MSLQQLHSGFVLLSFIFFVYSCFFVTFCFDFFYLCPLFFFFFICPIAVSFFPFQSYRFVYRFGHSLVPATLLSMAEGRSSRRPKQISLKEVFWGEQSTYLTVFDDFPSLGLLPTGGHEVSRGGGRLSPGTDQADLN